MSRARWAIPALCTSGVGYLDKLAQRVTPGKVFDWWGVALDIAAARLGGPACAWWRWTGKAQP